MLENSRVEEAKKPTKMNRSQSNLPKLTAFKAVRRKFAVVGITPELVAQSYPLNGRIFIGLLLFSSAIVCICLDIFKDNKPFAEYTRSINVATADGLLISVLVISILNVERLFEFIVHCESVVNISK